MLCMICHHRGRKREREEREERGNRIEHTCMCECEEEVSSSSRMLLNTCGVTVLVLSDGKLTVIPECAELRLYLF